MILYIKTSSNRYIIERGYEEALQVIYHVARHSFSVPDFITWIEKQEALQAINPIFRKYYSLQAAIAYYHVLAEGRKKKKQEDLIRELVRQTGFTYFLGLLKK